MKNILVFPCGSEIGLEIFNSLNKDIHFKLFGASSVDDHGKFGYENYIGGLPNITDKNFIEKLNIIIEKYEIDYIFPAHDSVVVELSKNKKHINCHVLTPSEIICNLARSKKLTYQFFKNLIPCPVVYNRENIHEVYCDTFFLKPDIGQGSKGCYKVSSKEEINFYLQKDPSLLILEYLPGEEITVDCFSNSSGELLYTFPRKRNRIGNGISVNSQRYIDVDDELKHYAKIIQKHTGISGPWFFQVKMSDQGIFKLMEFSPRIAGTMGLSRVIGVNIPKLTVYDAMGIDVSIIENKQIIDCEVDRALQSRYKLNYDFNVVFIDLDDTIIINDKVNTKMMEFIYKCTNKNIKIILITKHKNDLWNTFDRFHISESLFFMKFHLKYEYEKKSDYIHDLIYEYECGISVDDKCIFIDDSFQERKEVSEKIGMPVFDVDAIENLIF
jgi:hypothetical protein